VLRFGGRRRGARAYIAFDGGVDVPWVLGSRATHVLSRMGGLAGRTLQIADRIPLGPSLGAGARSGSVPDPDRGLTPIGGARIRILPGPQADLFDPDAYEVLQRSRYVVTPQSNRMGYRLAGPWLPSPPGDMISDVTFPGAIQVPPGGAPIMLMADRQTVGGYPQLAIVITADLPLAGQLAPGDWIEFAGCTMREAREALAAGDTGGTHG
jgi:antagonist of KipI